MRTLAVTGALAGLCLVAACGGGTTPARRADTGGIKIGLLLDDLRQDLRFATRSGSNDFSGSFRTGFTNDRWRSVTPADEARVDVLVPTYEFTAGGPVVTDRTWFFGAGRFFDRTTARQTGVTDVPFEFNANERRYEAKITQSLGVAQRLQVAYTGLDRRETNHASAGSSNVMDLASLTDRSLPQRLVSAHYTGVFGSRFRPL